MPLGLQFLSLPSSGHTSFSMPHTSKFIPALDLACIDPHFQNAVCQALWSCLFLAIQILFQLWTFPQWCLSIFKGPIHCTKSRLPSTSPPSPGLHWVSWQWPVFLGYSLQRMVLFLAHCRGQRLISSMNLSNAGASKANGYKLQGTDFNLVKGET